MSNKKDLVLKIGPYWRVKLVGIDEENEVVDDVVIDREDGKFFKMLFTRALGYIFPMLFETLNNKDEAGTICLLVRQRKGKKIVVVERKDYIDYRGEKVSGVRACRSSISSPEGSPIPKGTKKGNFYHLFPIELNNARLAGPVETYVVFQSINTPLLPGQELLSFEEFASINDGPGHAVLGQYQTLKHKLIADEKLQKQQK